MFDIISELLIDLFNTLNYFIPIVLIINLSASLLWGRGD